MVEDKFNYYYTQLITGLQESFSSLKGGTVYKATPPSFPYMYFRQIDGSTVNQTLSNTEESLNLGVQVEIYSTNSATEARNISYAVREIMIAFGFRCSYFSPVVNEDDTSIQRFMMRYSKLEA